MKKTSIEIDPKIYNLFCELNVLIKNENIIQYSQIFIKDLTRLVEPHLYDLSQFLKSISYSEFIKTPYWKIISAYIKWRDCYRCVQCNSNRQLETHHRTYENHGYEHLHLEDLYAFCNICHHNYHEQNPEIERYDLLK